MIRGGEGADTIISNSGTTNGTISGGKGNDRISNWGGAASMVGGGGNDSIWGDAGNDTLSGGSDNDRLYGDAGNDLLKGGTGNDSLWGGDGSDTFIYSSGDGKDVILGFDSGDLLQITGAFTASYNISKKEIYFNVGSTTKAITLTDFGSTTTFHVNSDTYQISGNQFKKR